VVEAESGIASTLDAFWCGCGVACFDHSLVRCSHGGLVFDEEAYVEHGRIATAGGVFAVHQDEIEGAFAFEDGLLAPQTRLTDAPLAFADYEPENFDRTFHGEVTASQANFLWVAHPTVDGGELVARLARAGVLVAGGDALGEPRHVRIGLRDSACSERLLGALDKALL